MEEDIQNNLPTVMFRGTPCIYTRFVYFDPEEVAYGGGAYPSGILGGRPPPWKLGGTIPL